MMIKKKQKNKNNENIIKYKLYLTKCSFNLIYKAEEFLIDVFNAIDNINELGDINITVLFSQILIFGDAGKCDERFKPSVIIEVSYNKNNEKAKDIVKDMYKCSNFIVENGKLKFV